MIKVCHMTSAHGPEDVRIFHKECVSLARAGYDVYLVERGDSYEKNGVHIVGVGQPSGGRLSRMTSFAKKVYQAALALDADIYHFHDPELLPYGLKLKKAGKKVIFDSHEDVPADILEKPWVWLPLRKLISWGYEKYEKFCFAHFDGLVGVTPSLCIRLKESGTETVMVTNYPILKEFPKPAFLKKQFVFPGLISDLWNIHVAIKAIEELDGVTLELRSGNADQHYLDQLIQLPGWKKVNYPGKVSHQEVMQLLSESYCGLALCRYCPNSGWKLGTLGNTKIFEYMMAGIPVICTDFDLWKEIIETYHCGICVKPNSVEEVQRAMRYLIENPEEAETIGKNGRQAIKEKFNWGEEEKKLLEFYKKL